MVVFIFLLVTGILGITDIFGIYQSSHSMIRCNIVGKVDLCIM